MVRSKGQLPRCLGEDAAALRRRGARQHHSMDGGSGDAGTLARRSSWSDGNPAAARPCAPACAECARDRPEFAGDSLAGPAVAYGSQGAVGVRVRAHAGVGGAPSPTWPELLAAVAPLVGTRWRSEILPLQRACRGTTGNDGPGDRYALSRRGVFRGG